MVIDPASAGQRLLKAKWQDSQCPKYDGVIRGTGEMFGIVLKWVDLVPDEPNETFALELTRSEHTCIDAWAKDPDSAWITCSAMYEVHDYIRDLAVECGETSDGNAGYVALSHMQGGLSWIAFFSNSNPFRRCEVEDDAIVVRSTFGDTALRFPIGRPESLEVVTKVILP